MNLFFHWMSVENQQLAESIMKIIAHSSLYVLLLLTMSSHRTRGNFICFNYNSVYSWNGCHPTQMVSILSKFNPGTRILLSLKSSLKKEGRPRCLPFLIRHWNTCYGIWADGMMRSFGSSLLLLLLLTAVFLVWSITAVAVTITLPLPSDASSSLARKLINTAHPRWKKKKKIQSNLLFPWKWFLI